MNRARIGVWIGMSLVVASTFSSTLLGQTPGKPNAKNSAGKNPAGSTQTPEASSKAALDTFQKQLVDDVSQIQTRGDYVVCSFSRDELLALRPTPEVSTLTAFEENQLRLSVAGAALSNKDAFGDGQANAFAQDVSETPFEGRTRSEALAKVLSILAQDTQSPETRALQYAAEVMTDADFLNYVVANYLQRASEAEIADAQSKVMAAKGSRELRLYAAQQVVAERNETLLREKGEKEKQLASAQADSQVAGAALDKAKKDQSAAQITAATSKAQLAQKKKALNDAQKSLLAAKTQSPEGSTLFSKAQGNDFQKYLANYSDISIDNFIKEPGSSGPPDSKIQAAGKLADKAKDSKLSNAVTAAQKISSLQKDIASLEGTVSSLTKQADAQQADSAEADAKAKQAEAENTNSKTAVIQAQGALDESASDSEKSTQAVTVVNGAQQGGNAAEAANAIADAARTAMGRPPDDVGCSMSILSYNTTRNAFGQTIADEFIPIQIIVRNLNPDKEFLIHDAKFAVDEDINGRFGSYAAGVDKLTAREYMLTSRDKGIRNLTISAVAGIGEVVGSTSLVFGGELSDASRVFSNGFIPALTRILPDHNTEQLNLLNDEGFSAYRTERTIVPKSGTAEFVIFIRADQYEQGWWTQDCAEQIVVKNPDRLTAKEETMCLGQYNLAAPDPRCWKDPGIRIDLEARRKVCLEYQHRLLKDDAPPKRVRSKQTAPFPPATEDSSPQPASSLDAEQPLNLVQDNDIRGTLLYFHPEKKAYKEWSPTAVAIFREISLAVVAGTHIAEEDTKPSLTNVDCPRDDQGDVDLSKTKSAALVCSLTGTNLDKVQSVKLEDAIDPRNTTNATGTVDASDAKNPKASFPLDQLGGLTGKLYKAFLAAKDGTEQATSLTLNFDPSRPVLSDPPSPALMDLSKLTKASADANKVTIKGYHLDNLGTVQLGTIPSKIAAQSSSASEASFTLTIGDIGTNIKNNGPDGTTAVAITLFLKNAPETPVATGQTLTLKGNVPTAPAPAKPATSADVPAKKVTKATGKAGAK